MVRFQVGSRNVPVLLSVHNLTVISFTGSKGNEAWNCYSIPSSVEVKKVCSLPSFLACWLIKRRRDLQSVQCCRMEVSFKMVFQWEFVCCISLLLKVPDTTWWLSLTWAQNNVLPPWTISLNPTQRGNNALSRPLYHHRNYVYITRFLYFSYCFCIHRTCNATLKHVWLQSSAEK